MFNARDTLLVSSHTANYVQVSADPIPASPRDNVSYTGFDSKSIHFFSVLSIENVR